MQKDKIISSRAELRRKIQESYLTDSELNGFMIDHFPSVYLLLSKGMDRNEKITLLFEKISQNNILAVLEGKTSEAQKSNLNTCPNQPIRSRALMRTIIGIALLSFILALHSKKLSSFILPARCVLDPLQPCLSASYLKALKIDSELIKASFNSGCSIKLWTDWLRSTNSTVCRSEEKETILYRILEPSVLSFDGKQEGQVLVELVEQYSLLCKEKHQSIACLKAGTWRKEILKAKQSPSFVDKEVIGWYIRACDESNKNPQLCSPLYIDNEVFQQLLYFGHHSRFIPELRGDRPEQAKLIRREKLIELCTGVDRTGKKILDKKMPSACFALVESYDIDKPDRLFPFTQAVEYAMKGCDLAHVRDSTCFYTNPIDPECDDKGIKSCHVFQWLCKGNNLQLDICKRNQAYQQKFDEVCRSTPNDYSICHE